MKGYDIRFRETCIVEFYGIITAGTYEEAVAKFKAEGVAAVQRTGDPNFITIIDDDGLRQILEDD